MAGGRRRSGWLWAGAALIVVTGVITIVFGLAAPQASASFGWFAYQPLANAVFVPGGPAIVLSPLTIVGWVVFTIGLLGLAFLAGRVTARRARGGGS